MVLAHTRAPPNDAPGIRRRHQGVVHPDVDERPWFVFRLSEAATAYVPAETEEQAREVMRRTSYPGAPVDSWPLIATRFCSRNALRASLQRKRT